MQSNLASTDGVSPLLFRHATPRTSSAELPGYYDPDIQLWVIETNAGFAPLVQMGDHSLLETNTVTKVRQEGDDNDLSSDEILGLEMHAGTLAELATKTDVQHESDDQMTASELLELETRSLNNQEGIDEDTPRMLLELQTKTAVKPEQDDDDSLSH